MGTFKAGLRNRPNESRIWRGIGEPHPVRQNAEVEHGFSCNSTTSPTIPSLEGCIHGRPDPMRLLFAPFDQEIH